MKKKIIFFIIIISNFLLLTNCANYTPIYSEQKKSDIIFRSININAESTVRKVLLELFNRTQKGESEKKYSLYIDVQQYKTIKTKDKAGNPVLYETKLIFEVKITPATNKNDIIHKKIIVENFYFKNLDSPSDTANNENNLIEDYTRVAFSKISLAINQFSKNDL